MATSNLEGNICLITGATSGIGEVTARRLAGMGGAVTIVGRNAERAAATRLWQISEALVGAAAQGLGA